MNGIKMFVGRPHSNQSGSALITVLLVLIIMSTLAMGYMLTSTSQQMLSRNRLDDSITFLAADAGIAYGITNLTEDTSWELRHLRNDKKPGGGYYLRSEGFLNEPYKVWDEETIPLPDNSYAYVRTWVEWDSPASCPEGECLDMFIVSLASYGTATKVVEAQYYFPIEVFNFAYFGRKAIKLDNHFAPATLNVESTAWTNGEFTMDKNMVMVAGEEEFIAAGGLVQIAGELTGTIYAPAVDTYGPDGEGFNGQADCSLTLGCWGTIYGNVYLMDGYFRNPSYDPTLTSQPRFLFRDPDATSPRTLDAWEQDYYCVDGGPPDYTGTCLENSTPMSYGLYASVATSHVGLKPGQNCSPINDPTNNYYRPAVQSCVIACSSDVPPAGKGCANLHDNPITPGVEGLTISYSNAGPYQDPQGPFDPNKRPRYAYRLPNRGGKVLLFRDFPELNWQALYDKAVAEKTVLPPTWYNRSLYIMGDRSLINWTDEPAWYDASDCDPSNQYTDQYMINGTSYVEIGQKDTGGDYLPTIWYIGDGPAYDANDDLIESSVRDLLENSPTLAPALVKPLWILKNFGHPTLGSITRGVIVHGAIVMEEGMLSPRDAGSHIYGCGKYDYYDANNNDQYDAGTDFLGHDPSRWQASPADEPSKTGNFPEDLITWMGAEPNNFFPNSGPDIPYSLPAIICGDNGGSVWDQDSAAAIKFIDRNVGPQTIIGEVTNPKTEFMFIHGAIFTYGQCYIHQSLADVDNYPAAGVGGTPPPGDGIEENRNINSTYFVYGSQVADVIHNNRYLAFEYDDCVKESVTGLFTNSNRDLVEVLNWRTIQEVQGIIPSH